MRKIFILCVLIILVPILFFQSQVILSSNQNNDEKTISFYIFSNIGDDYIDEKIYKEAIEAFEIVIQENPEESYDYFQIGYCKINLNLYNSCLGTNLYIGKNTTLI